MRPLTKAIFFDAVGTLIYLPQSVGEHYRQIGLRHGVDMPADSLDRAFRARWKAAPLRHQNGQGPRPDDDKGWWKSLVHGVLDDALPDPFRRQFDHARYFEELYAHFASDGVWAAFPEVHEILDVLQKRGFQLGMISNFDRRLYPILDHLQLTRFFTRIVVSSEVGADKPDPAIFQQALALMSVEACEAVHVGDDPRCDWGAEAVGLRVFKLERPAHTLRSLLGWLGMDG